jgi:hypothetical protein
MLLDWNLSAMRVRIRFRNDPTWLFQLRTLRKFASAFGALLAPVAAMAAVLAFWRIAADLKLAGSFGISTGVFSHWQVWLAAALLLQLCARLLNRFAKGEDHTASGRI